MSLRLLARDWRSGELTVLVTALLVAVTALTAVAFLTDRVGQAVAIRAAESLAADLRISSTRQINPEHAVLGASAGLTTATTASMPSVVFAGPANTLAGVLAVSENYPLRGQLKTAPRLLGEETIATAIPAPGEAWASPRLLARLGADTGVDIEIGAARLKLTRVLEHRPDEGWRFADLAPTLLINQADLGSTQLVQPGSRVSYRLLLSGTRQAIEGVKPDLEDRLEAGELLSDIKDTNPQIRSAMDRSGRFLNLASLVSVLLAAVAVAMAARRYSHRHRDRIALMKCMGARRSWLLRSSLLQLLVLALAGGALGSVLGFLAQQGLAWLMRDMIGQALPPAGMAPALLGVMTALCILAGFALPDLLQMSRTPPLRVLRRDVAPPPLRYGFSWIAAILALVMLLLWIVRDARLVMAILLGTAITFIALGLAGWLLVRLLQSLRGMVGVSWRYGLANLARRGRESIVQIVAFGLGLMVLLLLTTVRNELMDNWRHSLPDNAPNQFLVNIQPHEVPAMEDFLRQRGIPAPRFVPLVRARMTAINGQDVTQMTFEDPEGEEWARRDANLSWSAELQDDNRIVAGRFWQESPAQPEVSVEQDFAAELGLKLGDVLEFDIAGETLSAAVSSLRSVEWDSFSPNFFMLFSPGVLDSYPATYIASLFVAADQRTASMDLMRAFPSVTALDLDAMLSQVRDVMDKVALAVQAVFVFTLLAGLTVLWAAVQATRDERRYESAMLRTFGASRQRVLAGVAAEFVCIGLLAGVLAASGASLAGFLLATRMFELDYQFSMALWLTGPLAGMILVSVSGVAATWRVIRHPPVTVLRAS
ncbi:MAG TPA: FtsX-like permease family protein [Xanthomonadales bacterium]|nr:FtsX-like permease family protein [Xanthomonadales bacterium]